MADKQTAAADANQASDPLAALDKILNDTKQKATVQTKPTQAADADQADGQSDIDREKEMQQKMAREAHHAQLEAERLRLIKEQQQKLKTELKQTPQYQARLSQEAAKAEKIAQLKTTGDGFEIHQLDHTKI